MSLEKLRRMYGGQEDFVERSLHCGSEITAVSLESMCDGMKISEFVLKPLVGQQVS